MFENSEISDFRVEQSQNKTNVEQSQKWQNLHDILNEKTHFANDETINDGKQKNVENNSSIKSRMKCEPTTYEAFNYLCSFTGLFTGFQQTICSC